MAKGMRVKISKGGKIEIVTTGYTGEACLLATREITRKLGSVDSDVKTAEFFEAEQTQEQKAEQGQP